jgi:hypothetical protein
MKVENLRFEKNGDRARVAADVIWENVQRPVQEIYFETPDRYADSLSLNSHAFLVACIMPALHFGERRISVEGDVCPELKEGLINVMNWMRLWWYDPSKKLVEIEAKIGGGIAKIRTPERAGFFFSGGIDSVATLRSNRLNYPLNHPGSIKDGLLVCGLEVSGETEFEHVVSLISGLAEDASVKLVPVFTNIRILGPDDVMEFWDDFWVKEYMGAAFSAIAHAFARRLTCVYISSDHDIPNIYPFSSHPLINPNFSSFDLKIRLAAIALSRFDKSELVSTWSLAIQRLRVCNKTEYYSRELLNCGQCEKCVRTMLSLLALGVLEKASAFPYRNVTEEQIEKTGPLKANTVFFWNQLIIPLQKRGRHDLARAIVRKIDLYRKSEKKKRLRSSFIEPIIEFDERKLHGTLRKVKRIFYSKPIVTGSK